jgi:glycosyltransferase involved in cell wall biosynthesis
MKITIITVCLNSQDTLFDCLTSIEEQSHPDIESIIIDGGSTDASLSIINKFQNISKTLISEPDLGIYDALNKGMDLATGEIIGILHSDDIFASRETLAIISKAFEENPSFSCIHGDLVYVPRFEIHKINRFWKAGEGSKLKYLFGWMPPHPTFYLKKEIIQKVGGYRIDLGTAADYEFMLRIMVKFGFKSFYIRQVLVKMRTGGISNSSLTKRIQANVQDKKAWKVNNLKCFFFTIPLKPIRKIPQFILSIFIKY